MAKPLPAYPHLVRLGERVEVEVEEDGVISWRPGEVRQHLNGRQFVACVNHDEGFIEEEWPYRPLIPRIIKAGEISSKVYFILSGQIHIMSKDGQYDYGILYEGSYFGDISALLN